MTQRDDQLPDPLQALAEDMGSAGPALVVSDVASQLLIDTALNERRVRSRGWITFGAARRGRALGIAAFVLIGSSAAAAWYSSSRSDEPNQRSATNVEVKQARHAVGIPATPAQVVTEPVAEVAPSEAAQRSQPVPAVNDSESEDLLQRANRLRREGRPREAEQAYLQVVQQGSQTVSAYVARVAVAELQMARNPKGAIALFHAAQQRFPQGALDIEIRQGLAQAYRATGNLALERRELEQLIARHSSSLAADRARSRLSQMDQSP